MATQNPPKQNNTINKHIYSVLSAEGFLGVWGAGSGGGLKAVPELLVKVLGGGEGASRRRVPAEREEENLGAKEGWGGVEVHGALTRRRSDRIKRWQGMISSLKYLVQ